MDGFRKPRCEDCAFFLGDPDDDTSGSCRFNPPQVINLGAEPKVGWLTVLNDDWCGRWRNIHLEKWALWDAPEDVHNLISDP